MITENQLIKKITDKLIEIAKHPEIRKEFIVSAENREFHCYRNDPMMCDVDRYVLATFYAFNIDLYAKSEADCQNLYGKARNTSMRL